ncbi:MAG: hypothetical protein ACPIOQ_15010 [Promethearchaeia archaeon]
MGESDTDGEMATGFEDRANALIAHVFFQACTCSSTDGEDILPQEGGADGADDYSVFHVFSLLFPDIVGADDPAGMRCVFACALVQGANGLHCCAASSART